MGTARCDNILADLLFNAGHIPLNPCFSIHAIEIQNSQRMGKLYDTKNAGS